MSKLVIKINYCRRWCHAFADPNGKVLTSTTMLGRKGSYMEREITEFTVRGVLQRLIGDRQRYRLVQGSKDDYFADLEVSFVDNVTCVNHEVIYLRNILPSKDPSSFNGSVLSDLPQYSAPCAAEFWGIADMSLVEVCDFIMDDNATAPKAPSLDVLIIAEKFGSIKKRKAIENEGRVWQAIDKVAQRYPTGKYTKEGSTKVTEISLYVAALYLNAERLQQRGYDLTGFFTKNGNIGGFSRHNFNAFSDYMSSRSTGGYKQIYGNPYLSNFGRNRLIKKDGQLIITINASLERAIEIRELIENAGVTSFKLGKKGFAYVVGETGNLRIEHSGVAA